MKTLSPQAPRLSDRKLGPEAFPLSFTFQKHWSGHLTAEKVALRVEHLSELRRLARDFNKARPADCQPIGVSDVLTAALDFTLEHPLVFSHLQRPEQAREAVATAVYRKAYFRFLRLSAFAVVLFCSAMAGPVRAQEKRPAEKAPKSKATELEWQGVTQKTPSKTNYFLPTGFSFPARLENTIFSYNVQTPAIAVVDRAIKYLNKVVIPPETRIIGTVSVQQSHDRALINWQTMVFPEGDEIKLSGMALSLDGSAGLRGKVESHKDSDVANTVLRSVVSGTQAALEISGVSPIASQATQGVSQEALRELDLQKQQVTTSITVESDTGLRVFLHQRLEY